MIAAALLAAVVLFISWSCGGEYSGPTESITFGAIPSGSAALVYIAQDQHYFDANGLIVNVKDYPTGIATIDALLSGDVDIAWSAEFPLVRKAFVGEKISIIAVVSRFSDQYLFCCKDHGIENISDLKDKEIGVPRNTIAEFYLARFLELHGMDMHDVSLIDIQPSQSLDAVVGGSVDGVVTWQPFACRIETQLADKVVIWPVQSSQAGYGVVICRNDWISLHPDIVNRFLKSLAEAECYLIRNPEAAKAIVQKRVNYDDDFMETFWSETQFYLSLDQSLITAMEDEARWMISDNLTTAKTVPDFLIYINEDSLKAVKPEVVNIIR